MKRTELQRTVGLARGPAKLSRTGALSRSAGTPRATPQRPAKSGDWPPQVRALVAARSAGCCEVGIAGKCTRVATDLHHRQPRRTRQHTAGNALHVCRACHGAVHTVSPALSAHMGWSVSTYAARPATQPVFIAGRWRLLHDDGTTTPTEAPL